MPEPKLHRKDGDTGSETLRSITVRDRSQGSDLEELAGGTMHFSAEGGSSSPWTLAYEELIFVSSGRLRVHCGDMTITGDPGDVISIPQGIEVVYEGEPHTVVFYALTPSNWHGAS